MSCMARNKERVSLVIPAHNEEKRIYSSLMKLSNFFSEKEYDYEIIVSEDGSTDRTYEIVKNFSKKDKRVKVLHSDKKLGKGGGIIKGFKKTTGDIVIFSDADLSSPPTEMVKLIEEINSGADIAIASRRIKHSQIIKKRPLMKKIGSLIFNILVNFLFHLNIKDTQCGLKAIKKNSLKKILPKLTRKGWELDVELLFRARQNNLRISEVPVVWSHKEASKFSFFSDSYKMGVGLVGLWFKEMFNKFDLFFLLTILLFFFGCLFLLGYNPEADEGTHNLLALFFYNFINDWIKSPTISFDKIYEYTITYIVYYPKLSLYYPPLYHVILSFTYRLFGISSFTGDLTTLFFSLGTVSLIFIFSKKILKNSKIGIVSVLIFLFSPMILYLSIKTLTDIPMLFLSFLSIYFYLLSLKTNRTRYFVISSFIFSLSFLTKWNTILLLPIIFLYTLLEHRQSLKKLILSFILVIILLSPYFLILQKAGALYIPLKSSMIEPGYREGDPQYTSIEGWLYYPRKLSELYFTPIILVLSLFSLVIYCKKREKYWKLFLVWFVVCLLFFTWLPNKNPRYILLIIPSLLFPLSNFVLSYPKKIKMTLLSLIFIILLVSNYMYLKQFMYITDFSSVVNEVTKEDGNIFLASETSWFYSSAFMYKLASVESVPQKKVFRPCVLNYYNISEFLEKEGIRYVIITEPYSKDYEGYIKTIEESPELVPLKIIEGNNRIVIYNNTEYRPSKSMCNYVCLLEDWVCSNHTIPSEALNFIF